MAPTKKKQFLRLFPPIMYFLLSRIKILSSAGLIAKEEIKAIPWYLHQMVTQTTLRTRVEQMHLLTSTTFEKEEKY